MPDLKRLWPGQIFEESGEHELVMALIDTDGDGFISFREFHQWWRKNREASGLPVPPPPFTSKAVLSPWRFASDHQITGD